jgi:hypothetical protein
MAAKSILWVLVFEGETFDIHLLPSGEAFASLGRVFKIKKVEV